ncbi:sensor histidine kinase [Catenuloplanes japonicus]|uniref:sensor histidine kinase n=1 Tax=Catenuloplanes japonicus TaxID=33876 RepID=UPI000690A923|nr:histidine kinase [Catenuloplanes japonicus]
MTSRWPRLTYEAGLALTLAATATATGLPSFGDRWPVAVIVLIACADVALVALRRSYPLVVLIVAAVLTALTGQNGFFLIIGLSVSAGFRVRSTAWLTGTFLAVFAVQLAETVWTDEVGGPATFAFVTGAFVVFNALPGIAGRMHAQRRELLRLMHERTVHLEEQQRTTAERVRAREATRLAREMHDSLGHRLTLLSLYSGALQTAPDRAAEVAPLLHTTSTQAMDELRQILAVLRDSQPGDDTAPARLDDADALVEGARSAGARITLAREGEPVPLHPLIDHAAYRTLQEGVTNALRHARGGEIRLALRYEPDALVAEVVNTPGLPHDGPSSGQGLRGLAERVRLTGGVLYHGREPDGGFRIAATLPLTPQAPTPGSAADEVRVELQRVDRSRRRAWAVVAAGLVAVVALCTGGAWTAMTQYMVAPATYRDLAVGTAEAEVRARLPEREAGTVESYAPGGPDCIVYPARLTFRAPEAAGRYRFCFRDGALFSKEMLDS